MPVLGVDIGGTKLAAALICEDGTIIRKEYWELGGRKGTEVGSFVTDMIRMFNSGESQTGAVESIGISVPGISYPQTGRVWVPNIEGWTDYPLMDEVRMAVGKIPVTIDNDRACYILGEAWKGKAVGCRDAIFIGVGTGIGAGILVNGSVLRGSSGIAGAIGWLALEPHFLEKYIACGCFEYNASGEGIARVAREMLKENISYSGILRETGPERISARTVFEAFEKHDWLAEKVLLHCVEFWGMAAANLVSLFNPRMIIFGGGIFGPAGKLLAKIKEEAEKWAQPVSMKEVGFEVSGLGGDAGIYGAGYLALKRLADEIQ
jgi:glucokinase